MHLAGNDFRDGSETDAVFVTEGKIAEQIADGGQATLFEDCGAVRADASKIFHRICQRDSHAFKGSGQSLMVSRNETRRTFIPLSVRWVSISLRIWKLRLLIGRIANVIGH
jgi:hypothetical protein